MSVRCARVGLELTLQLFSIHKSREAFVDFAQKPSLLTDLFIHIQLSSLVCWKSKDLQVIADATRMLLYVVNEKK